MCSRPLSGSGAIGLGTEWLAIEHQLKPWVNLLHSAQPLDKGSHVHGLSGKPGQHFSGKAIAGFEVLLVDKLMREKRATPET
ncbi:hypothetical protein DFR39_101610 [Roseateles asaccharophilus]|uniref:Uncharacterized protein n=1 Tax=Roseateles asaccharophilus TaxID=582607 RepID=A0A4R6NBJ5_9BURK|nr:hypothetical protein DFR39_101610 [Roseateles asaccharophilus]